MYKNCVKCEKNYRVAFKSQNICDECAQNFGCAVCGAVFERGTYHNCIKDKRDSITSMLLDEKSCS